MDHDAALELSLFPVLKLDLLLLVQFFWKEQNGNRSFKKTVA